MATFFCVDMIQIDDKLLSIDLFQTKYVCDIGCCKGQCCIEGDSGAPLDDAETDVLEQIYPQVRPYLTEQEQAEIERQGKWVVDSDGDKVTPLVNNAECVYTYRTDDGTWMCAIERAYRDGKIDFMKPISCHLYPIRITRYRTFEAVNLHEWDVCKAAFALGQKLDVPVFRFLKTPIIRKYGQAFYDEMENIFPEIQKIKRRH